MELTRYMVIDYYSEPFAGEVLYYGTSIDDAETIFDTYKEETDNECDVVFYDSIFDGEFFRELEAIHDCHI